MIIIRKTVHNKLFTGGFQFIKDIFNGKSDQFMIHLPETFIFITLLIDPYHTKIHLSSALIALLRRDSGKLTQKIHAHDSLFCCR